MNEISIMYLLQLAWRRIWAIIIAAAVFAACAFCFCKFFATPSYTATASVIVSNGAILSQQATTSDYVSGTDITASLNLTDTITDILKTPDIFKEMADKFDDKYTYAQLMGMVSVSRHSQNTFIVDVKFSASVQSEAISLANAFVELAPDYITKFVPNSNAATLSKADKASQTYPRTLMLTAVFGLLGAAIAFIIALIVDSFDQAIKGDDDFTSNYTVPLLGTVPDFENAGITATPKGDYKNAAQN